jgi:hypothetical protein
MAEGGGGSVPDHDLRRRFEGQLSKFTNVVKGWQFRYTVSVLDSVADPGCLSRIRLFSIPDPNCLHPGSRILINEFKYDILTPKKAKKWFLSSKNMIRVVHPGSGADFLPSRIPDPGVKKATSPGSRIRIRNTGFGSAMVSGRIRIQTQFRIRIQFSSWKNPFFFFYRKCNYF